MCLLTIVALQEAKTEAMKLSEANMGEQLLMRNKLEQVLRQRVAQLEAEMAAKAEAKKHLAHQLNDWLDKRSVFPASEALDEAHNDQLGHLKELAITDARRSSDPNAYKGANDQSTNDQTYVAQSISSRSGGSKPTSQTSMPLINQMVAFSVNSLER